MLPPATGEQTEMTTEVSVLHQYPQVLCFQRSAPYSHTAGKAKSIIRRKASTRHYLE